MKTPQLKWKSAETVGHHRKSETEPGGHESEQRQLGGSGFLKQTVIAQFAFALFAIVTPLCAGELEQFFYTPLEGAEVSDLTLAPTFPEQPFVVTPVNWFSSGLEGVTNASTYYGSWLRGYLEAPVSGEYTFYLSADDSAELYLSTDHQTANKQLIAVATAAVPVNDYREQPGQKSLAIDLERGRQYYFEIRHKQGAGTDHVQVGWLRPDDILERPIPLRYVQRFVPQSYTGPGVHEPSAAPPEIFFPALGNTIAALENENVVIAPNVSALPPVFYQWFKDGMPLAGETLSSLDLGQIAEANDGEVYTLLAATRTGIALSDDFTLRVNNDVTAPTIVRAAVTGMTNGFVLTFSEPVEPGTATNTANYTMNLGITVTNVRLLYETNLTTVVVRTSPFPTVGIPEVTVNHVRDIAQPPNTIAPNATKPVSLADGKITLRYFGDAFRTADWTGIPEQPTPQERFPDSPDLVTSSPEMGIPNNVADNYIAQLIGYLVPPVTGDYRFFIASDDQGILYLSSNADPLKKRVIAFEPLWNGYRSFTTTERRTIEYVSDSPNFPPIDPQKAVNDSINILGLIHLEAGRRYYFEAVMKEGGGGDNLDVAWQMPGGPPVVDYQPPIPGDFLAQWPDANGGDVAILEQPVNSNAREGRRVTLSVGAKGTPPLEYQWFRNGERIVDATESSYTFPARWPDNGAHYSVRVRNDFSEAWSDDAMLFELPDRQRPQILRAAADQYFNKVWVRFDEPVSPVTATNVVNYTITHTDNGRPLVVIAVEPGGFLDGGYTSVVLRTDSIESGENYTIRTTGIEDLAEPPNRTGPENAAATFSGWVLSRGFVSYRRYDDIAGGLIANFKNAAKYPDAPDFQGYLTSWAASQTPYDTFGSVLSGYLIPGKTGDHTFYISANDAAELWLSTDALPSNKRQIAATSPWSGNTTWQGDPPDHSEPVSLNAGEYYYMELLHIDAGGGDFARATYNGSGEPVPAGGSLSRLTGDVIATWANPDGVQFHLPSEPQDQIVDEGQTVYFSVTANANNADGLNLPIVYQWQTNGVNVAGAAAPDFTMQFVPLADDGLAVRCRVSAPGGFIYTRTAQLAVLGGETSVDAYVTGGPSQDRVVVNFVEAVNAATATDLANYSIDGLSILDAEIWPNGHTVVLTTSQQISGTHYTLHYSGIRDISVAGNVLPPGEFTFSPWTKELGWVRQERYYDLAAPTISALIENSKYRSQPDAVDFPPRLDVLLTNAPAGYTGVRLSGWLQPPESDNYDFYIAASEQALFLLSPDSNDEHLIPVVAEPIGQALREYASPVNRVGTTGNDFFPDVTTLPINRSTSTVGAIHLEAGREYAFEVLAVGGTAPLYVSVVMVPAGSPMPVDGTIGIAGDQVINFTNPDNQISIEPPPPYLFAAIGNEVTLYIVPLPYAQPVTYQWQRDGVDLDGETGPTLSFTADTSLHGSRFRCRLARPGSVVFSPPTLLAVGQPPIELNQEDGFFSVTLPSTAGPVTLQSRSQFGQGSGWIDEGTVAPFAGMTAFTFPANGGERYFRILPASSP